MCQAWIDIQCLLKLFSTIFWYFMFIITVFQQPTKITNKWKMFQRSWDSILYFLFISTLTVYKFNQGIQNIQKRTWNLQTQQVLLTEFPFPVFFNNS